MGGGYYSCPNDKILGSSRFEEFALNFLPNNKILALTKLKAFTDEKFNVAKNTDFSVSDRVFKVVLRLCGKDLKDFDLSLIEWKTLWEMLQITTSNF